MKLPTLLIILSLAAPVAAQTHDHDHPEPEQLGRVHFETSCAPEVSAAFDRAVALLHSFSFSTAKQAFEGIAEADPSCAMAHWGIAMTQWSNPFSLQRSAATLAAGQAAAVKAMTTGTPTPRERAYIAAVRELYRDYETVDQRTRVLAYERAMESLHKAYPDDREATAFYALAINQTALPADKTYTQQLKAAALLEGLFADDPEHPGLAHYIIHAYDHPPLASRALEAARRYATIAPSAPHALHMPSHTFTRVGYWQDSIDTNIASAATALRDGSVSEALHAMDYQVYAYLQTAQDDAARGVVDEAPRVLAQLDPDALGGAAPPVAGFYAAAAIPARYAMERGAWQEAADLELHPTPFAYVDAITHFARAVGAARSGASGAAKVDSQALKALGERLSAAGETYWAEQVRTQHDVAAAWIVFAEGRQEAALDRLRAAVAAEDASDKSAISPGPLAPARELLGEMLLAMNQPEEALSEFEATLKKEPNRFRATHLAAQAARKAGNSTAARKHYAALVAICKAGDTPGRPELEEAREAAGSTGNTA
jgi:tetratricopeptide (TPR) repeat protein